MSRTLTVLLLFFLCCGFPAWLQAASTDFGAAEQTVPQGLAGQTKTSPSALQPSFLKRHAIPIGVCAGLLAGIGAFDKQIHENIPELLTDRFGRRLDLHSVGKHNSILDDLGNPVGFFGISGGFYLGGLIGRSENTRKVGILAAEAGLVGSALTGGIKFLVGRERPTNGKDADTFKPLSGHDSFPSGHTSTVFSVATVISTHYDSIWVSGISYGLAGMVGLGRMFQNHHWASDVTAGAMLGYGSGKLVTHWENRKHWSRRLYTDGRSIFFVQRF